MKRILIIEDNFYVRVHLDDQLEEHGFEVVLCKRVREALMKLKAQVFNAIVTSYDDDFFATLRLLATIRAQGNKIPVLCLTKRPTEDQMMQFMNYRPVEVMVKPYSIVELVERLNHLSKAGVG
jgi:DNA-binding response OmpR family regulator